MSDKTAPFLESIIQIQISNSIPLESERKRDEILAMFFQLAICSINSLWNLQTHLAIIVQTTF